MAERSEQKRQYYMEIGMKDYDQYRGDLSCQGRYFQPVSVDEIRKAQADETKRCIEMVGGLGASDSAMNDEITKLLDQIEKHERKFRKTRLGAAMRDDEKLTLIAVLRKYNRGLDLLAERFGCKWEVKTIRKEAAAILKGERKE